MVAEQACVVEEGIQVEVKLERLHYVWIEMGGKKWDPEHVLKDEPFQEEWDLPVGIGGNNEELGSMQGAF